jgi:hypothetical protein
MAFSVGTHRARHILEHFSEDDQSQLDEGKKPGPEHKRERDLYHHFPSVDLPWRLDPFRTPPR